MGGGLGFFVESQVTKKGLCPLAFLSMAIFRALAIISIRALCCKATCSFFIPPITKTSSTSTRSLKPTTRLWFRWTWASTPITPTWFNIPTRFDIEATMPYPCCSNIGKDGKIDKLGPTCCANWPTPNEANVWNACICCSGFHYPSFAMHMPPNPPKFCSAHATQPPIIPKPKSPKLPGPMLLNPCISCHSYASWHYWVS